MKIQFNRQYCRTCGSIVTVENRFDFGHEKAYCPKCGWQTTDAKDFDTKAVSGAKLSDRMERLRGMKDIMETANDEFIYSKWIAVFPDEASEGEMFDIALDDENFEEVWQLFKELIVKKNFD